MFTSSYGNSAHCKASPKCFQGLIEGILTNKCLMDTCLFFRPGERICHLLFASTKSQLIEEPSLNAITWYLQSHQTLEVLTSPGLPPAFWCHSDYGFLTEMSHTHHHLFQRIQMQCHPSIITSHAFVSGTRIPEQTHAVKFQDQFRFGRIYLAPPYPLKNITSPLQGISTSATDSFSKKEIVFSLQLVVSHPNMYTLKHILFYTKLFYFTSLLHYCQCIMLILFSSYACRLIIFSMDFIWGE